MQRTKTGKLPFFKRTHKVRCTNCNKPLKLNLVERKTTIPQFCYHCFLLKVKSIKYYFKGSKRIDVLKKVSQNIRYYSKRSNK